MNEESYLPARVPGRYSWTPTRHMRPADRFFKASLLHTSFQQYKNALKRRWWIPVLTLLLLGGPAVYYTWKTPSTYRSQTMLWAGNKLQLPEGHFYAEELSSYIGTQVELIKSSWIKERALARTKERFPKAGIDERAFDIVLTTSPKSSTVQLAVTGRSPDATRFFTDALVQEYMTFKEEARKKTSTSAVSTISDEIKTVEKDIQEKQRQITGFQNANNVSFLTESGTSAGSRLARLNELLSDLRTEYRALELMTPEQLKGMAEAMPAATTGGVVLPGQRSAQSLLPNNSAQQAGYYQALQQLQMLTAKRDEFATVLRPTHSKMVKLNQEIAALEQFMGTLKQKGEQDALAQISTRKKALQLQIENVEAQARTWEANASEASRKLVEYDRLKQELERSNALYNRLMSLVQTVDLTKGLDQEALSQVAPSSPAKVTLSKYKLGVAGVFLGVVIGFGMLLILSIADDRFTSVSELTLHLPEQIVGQVPESKLRRLSNGNGHMSVRRLEQQQAFDESFRSLRSYLLCMSDLPPGPKVIMVTSAVPKEGKTTISANLGAALALAGERVLLIDADLRRSSLHKLFNVNATPGLREVLEGNVSPAKAIAPSAQQNLFVMPAGDGASSGSELFLLRPMVQMLEELNSKYDYIIIDSAPVLATDDATSIGPKTQGAFVVIRDSYTSARMVREALDRLHKRHVKVLGVVYNRVSHSKDYFSRYSRDYYAGNDIACLPGVVDTKANEARHDRQAANNIEAT